MGPPDTEPSGCWIRYFTPSVHSTNLEAIPSTPATMSQKMAPGPPMEMATATCAMLPTPTVPDRAVASAWKWEISPGSVRSSALGRSSASACFIPRKLIPRK